MTLYSSSSIYLIVVILYDRLTAAPRHKVIDNNLNIKEVTLDDGGLYVCRATQSNPMIADFREMNITLKIQRKFIYRTLFSLLVVHAAAAAPCHRVLIFLRVCLLFLFIYLF